MCLKRFFDELRARNLEESSLVVIVGDHGFPMGEHGNYLNISRAYPENLRTICLFRWPRKLQERLLNHCGSQVDVGPTILHLLGIQAPSGFKGRSLLQEESEGNVALCTQPYDGGYVCAMHAGYSLVYSCQSRAMLFRAWDDKYNPGGIPAPVKERLKFSLVRMAADLYQIEGSP